MSELLKLAKRCEAAIGPDRELDAAIAIANGSKAVVSYGHPALGNFYRAPAFFKHYTASLDAAMTLLPDRAWWSVEAQPLGSGKYLSECGDERVASAVSPALALCAAALRARDALTNSEGGGE